jgi:hypothetical protein
MTEPTEQPAERVLTLAEAAAIEARRRAMVSLIGMVLGMALATVGAGVTWGVGAAVLVLGSLTFVIAVLVGITR